MKKLLIQILPFILITLFSGCKKGDGGTGPEPAKDPRSYTWKADTLFYPGNYQTLMNNIWGNSPKDVYAVGHSSSSDGVLWHFDGIKWNDVNLVATKGGTIPGAFDLSSIFGFTSTDVYAVGARIRQNYNPPPNFIDSSLIIHYDGSSWKQVNVYNGSSLTNIYGTSSSDIWAAGIGKQMYHYINGKWETDSINIAVQSGYFFQITSIKSYNSEYYMIANSNNNSTAETITYFIKRINNKWVPIDSTYDNGMPKFGDKLATCNLPDLYSTNPWGIYKYNGSGWEHFYQDNNGIIGMWGNTDKNIFAVGGRGRVFNYNGTDWKQIEELNNPQTDYFAVWTDGTEAFVVGHINDGSAQKTIIWHGK